MIETIDRRHTRRLLPAAAECLRATSGLVAIVALLVIILAVGSAGGPEAARPMAGVPVSAAPRTEAGNLSAAAPIPSRADTMVFYLVTTPAQEAMADSGENVDQSDTRRTYHILYGRDDPELELARQTIMAHLLTQDDAALVRVVDMRVVR